MMINSSGNVGIGTTTPAAKMPVYNSVMSTMLTGDSIFLRNQWTGAGWARSVMGIEDVNGNDYWSMGGLGSGQSWNYGFIGTAYNTTAIKWDASNQVAIGLSGTTNPSHPFQVGSNSLVVSSGGNVGIGMSPTNKLDIVQDANTSARVQFANPNSGSSAFASWALSNGTNQNEGLELRTHGTGYTSSGAFLQDGTLVLAGSEASGGMSIGTRHASADMRFYTGGVADANERMRITSVGLVGIGTTTPSHDLDVDGDIGVTGLINFGNGMCMGEWTGTSTPNVTIQDCGDF